MKKRYEKPVLATEAFDAEDVITVSGDFVANMLHQVAGLAHHGTVQEAALPARKSVSEGIPAVVRPHLRGSRRPQQRQLQCVPVHAYAILAVVQHRRAMALVAQSTVALVAHLEAVGIVQSRAVCGPLYITELDFIDSL